MWAAAVNPYHLTHQKLSEDAHWRQAARILLWRRRLETARCTYIPCGWGVLGRRQRQAGQLRTFHCCSGIAVERSSSGKLQGEATLPYHTLVQYICLAIDYCLNGKGRTATVYEEPTGLSILIRNHLVIWTLTHFEHFIIFSFCACIKKR